ncbi:argininosuccinate lyase [Bordetella genomosp. 10]|uniref:Argininosuccinate lyase n=1 Tax=Bordetella genomosp. 10 TaxID=1416804 RepID=A0A261S2L4_9BORD|nr:argininosuccinate lyase [Bordetella genomosp. 10]OZI31598.1 argininosuccinate lyase [Bordetella genomosp. 10]
MESKVSRRLKEAIAPEVREYVFVPRLNREFHNNFVYLTSINQAHLLMLHATGLMDTATAATLARALARMEEEGPDAVELDAGREEAYFNYEARLMEIAGRDAGGRLHMARSRNDMGATVDRMKTRAKILDLIDAMAAVHQAAMARAREHADAVMPGYTHLQPAQPITYGYYLTAVAETILRDIDRLNLGLRRLDACPLGAGALAGTAFPIDRSATAAWLGFTAAVPNALDAVASRDFAWELMSSVAIAAVTWSRVAQDYYVWSTPEFGLIEFPDSVASTSSIMPQKKNPAVLEHLKGKAAHMVGLLTASMATIKGTNFTHTGDGSRESMRSFYEAVDEAKRCLALFRLIVDRAQPRRDAMLFQARTNFSTATDLADALVREAGMSFRDAHHVVGAVVRRALDAGIPADRIDAALIDAAAMEELGRPAGLEAGTVADCLDPARNVAARKVMGGPAHARVLESVERQEQARIRLLEEVSVLRRRLADADETLKRQTRELAAAGH